MEPVAALWGQSQRQRLEIEEALRAEMASNQRATEMKLGKMAAHIRELQVGIPSWARPRAFKIICTQLVLLSSQTGFPHYHNNPVFGFAFAFPLVFVAFCTLIVSHTG